MNWLAETWGTNLMDFSPEAKIGILDSAHEEQRMYGRMTGLDQFLVLPLHENPLNFTSVVLASQVAQNWVHHFFHASRAGPCNVRDDRADLGVLKFDNLAVSPGTMRLVWTYGHQAIFHSRTPREANGWKESS